LSTRKGYWLVSASGAYDGPYKTISEAKQDAQSVEETVTVQAMVAFERRDERGEWHTLH
jgi:hypothetical protein